MTSQAHDQLQVSALPTNTAEGSEPPRIKVTVQNFTRAETDHYFAKFVREGALGKLQHARELTPIERQPVIRLNRDTLYSIGVFDLDAGPVTVTLPDAGARYLAAQVVDENHFALGVYYAPGRKTITRDEVGSRYMALLIRVFVDPNRAGDLDAVHLLQDGIEIEQASAGRFEPTPWDQESLVRVRKALLGLAAASGGFDSNRMFGRQEEVDPVQHLIGTATAWGGNPRTAAIYIGKAAEVNNGSARYTLTLKETPVDSFWSVSVYNREGFFEQN